jgi:hypothetical protein
VCPSTYIAVKHGIKNGRGKDDLGKSWNGKERMKRKRKKIWRRG